MFLFEEKKKLFAFSSEKFYLLWRGLLWLHVKGKVARLALLVDVLELWVDHVTSH